MEGAFFYFLSDVAEKSERAVASDFSGGARSWRELLIPWLPRKSLQNRARNDWSSRNFVFGFSISRPKFGEMKFARAECAEIFSSIKEKFSVNCCIARQ